MKRVIGIFLAVAMVCTMMAVPVFSEGEEAVLFDDFIIEGKAYSTSGLECVDSDYDSLREQEGINWMLTDQMSVNGYDKLEYFMQNSARNTDGVLTYQSDDFGGKMFAVVGIYTTPLIEKLANGDWYDWKAFYNNMPFKLYAGPSEDNMTELEPTHFRTASWYPSNYLEYIVESLPEGTKFVKAVIPALDTDDYGARKIGRVEVTADKSRLVSSYVNPYLPFTADDACHTTFRQFFINGEEASVLAEGDITAKAVVINERSAKIPAVFFTGLYKDGQLVEVKTEEQTINGYQTVIFSTENTPLKLALNPGESIEQYDVKMWVLTDIGTIGKATSLKDTVSGKPEINPADFKNEKIVVLTPEYRNEISGNTTIRLMAPGFETVTAKCWQQGEGYGQDTEFTVTIDETGYGEFIFPADEYPHGPLMIRLEAGEYDEFEEEWLKRDMNNLQVYNLGGVSWQEGLESAPVNPVAQDLEVLFEDDFDGGELSMSRWDSSTTYSSHKPRFQDFSGVYFRDYEDENLCAFGTVDSYLRIRADENKNSTGILSTAHQDFTGVMAKWPAYFECRMIAQYATGTWPAVWWISNNPDDGPADEIDIIEAYGFDEYNQSHYNGFHSGFHEWGREVPTDPDFADGKMIDMRKTGDGTNWFTKFHTYGMYVGEKETIMYLDNQEIWRFQTWPSTYENPLYMMVNLAIGGSSGWPRDLSRYDGIVDMYVDWIRIFN